MAILDDYMRRRADDEGVWINTVEFRQMLQTRPTLAALRDAYPEVEMVPFDEAHADLRVTWFDVVQAQLESDLDLTESFRSDQSRFIANIDDGRVVGGTFR